MRQRDFFSLGPDYILLVGIEAKEGQKYFRQGLTIQTYFAIILPSPLRALYIYFTCNNSSWTSLRLSGRSVRNSSVPGESSPALIDR